MEIIYTPDNFLSIAGSAVGRHIGEDKPKDKEARVHKIFKALREFFSRLFEDVCPADPVTRMTPRELADLPVHHPEACQ